jgi:hypothetical protein
MWWALAPSARERMGMRFRLRHYSGRIGRSDLFWWPGVLARAEATTIEDWSLRGTSR